MRIFNNNIYLIKYIHINNHAYQNKNIHDELTRFLQSNRIPKKIPTQ